MELDGGRGAEAVGEGLGLSRTFHQQFPASLKTGSQFSREPPAVLPEPPSDSVWGVCSHTCVFADGLEIGGTTSVCMCLCVCLVRGVAQRRMHTSVMYLNVVHISVNSGSRCGLIGASASLGPGVRLGVCQQWVLVCPGKR